MSTDNYFEPNLCYESNYSGFDQFQAPQPPIIHQPPQETSVEISHDHENNVVGNKQNKPEDVQELFRKLINDVQNIHEELAEYINIPSWNYLAFSCHDDDDENYTSEITPKEPDNSLGMGDKHLYTILAMESDEVIKSSVENLVPIPSKSEGIPDNTCDVPFLDDSPPLDASPLKSELVSLEEVKDDNLCKKLLNVNLLIAKIKSLNDNPTPDHMLKSLSPFPIPVLFLGEVRYFSLIRIILHPNSRLSIIRKRRIMAVPLLMLITLFPKKNSGSTTIHADISLPDLECFNFKREPDPGELTSIVDSKIRENLLSATNVNLPPEDDHSPLFAYVVWIFLSFLTYFVVPPNLISFGNVDTIFNPDISNYHISSFMPGVSHQSGTFMKFNVYPNLLNESSREILSSTTFPKDH
nr:hypothetical protein [Tanacetum cinerariifolium]